MADISCTIPPLRASARTLASFFPSGHLGYGIKPVNLIHFYYAWMRAIRKISMATGSGARFLGNRNPLASGIITAADTTGGTWVEDSDVDFTATPHRCGEVSAYSGAIIHIYPYDDPGYVIARSITAAAPSGHTHRVNVDTLVPAIDRGQIVSLSSLVGCLYEIFEAGDLCDYDRWPDRPNSREYVAQYQLVQDEGVPGSIGYLPTKLLTFTGTASAGSYVLHSGASDTSAIAWNASTDDLATAIGTAAGGSVAVMRYSAGLGVQFGPDVTSPTLTVTSQSLTGATVAVSAIAAGTVVDPRVVTPMNTTPGQMPVNGMATAPFKSLSGVPFPDGPTSLDLVIYDNGTGGDNHVHRAPITANGPDTFTVGSFANAFAVRPSLGFYYSVIGHNPVDGDSLWTPKAKGWTYAQWYAGVMRSDRLKTHLPSDTIGTYQQAALTVSFDDGTFISSSDECTGPTEHDAKDQDVRSPCVPKLCSPADKIYAPDIWKNPRTWQKWLLSLELPWVYLPLWTDKTNPPPAWNAVDVAADLGIGAPFNAPYPRMIANDKDLNALLPSVQTDDMGVETVVDPPGIGNNTDDPATVTLTLTGGVATGYTITHAGSLYTSVPRLTVGGDGTGAKLLAHLTGGALSSVTIVSGGTGYTTAPVTVSGGGPILIGLWTSKAAATTADYFDFGYGEGGPAIAAGQLARLQGMQAYQSTLAGFADDDVLLQYRDKVWQGTCGPTPPNTRYAGVRIASTDPTNAGYKQRVYLGVHSDGTGLSDQVGPLPVKSYANRSGLTSQLTVTPSNVNGWWEYWFSTDRDGTSVTGTATAGAADTVTDSGAPFKLSDWGRTISVTHAGTPHTAAINGVSADGKTVKAVGLGLTVTAGDTYALTRQGGVWFEEHGVLTGATSTTLTDGTRIGDPWFVSGYFDGGGGNVVRVYHEVGDGTQTVVRHIITAVDPATGKFTVDAVTGDPSAAGDRWIIEVPGRTGSGNQINRWSGAWATVTLPAGFTLSGGATSFDAEVFANDRDTLWITQAAGHVITDDMVAAGVTVTLNTFPIGAVLKRSAGNARWFATGSAAAGAETRTDHATGSVATFRTDPRANAEDTVARTGVWEFFTYITAECWDQMYALVVTLHHQMISGLIWNNIDAAGILQNWGCACAGEDAILACGHCPPAGFDDDYIETVGVNHSGVDMFVYAVDDKSWGDLFTVGGPQGAPPLGGTIVVDTRPYAFVGANGTLDCDEEDPHFGKLSGSMHMERLKAWLHGTVPQNCLTRGVSFPVDCWAKVTKIPISGTPDSWTFEDMGDGVTENEYVNFSGATSSAVDGTWTSDSTLGVEIDSDQENIDGMGNITYDNVQRPTPTLPFGAACGAQESWSALGGWACLDELAIVDLAGVIGTL